MGNVSSFFFCGKILADVLSDHGPVMMRSVVGGGGGNCGTGGVLVETSLLYVLSNPLVPMAVEAKKYVVL